MISFQTLIRALRLPFASATVVPVLFGGVFSFVQTGAFDWLAFVVVLLITVSVHLGSNVINDYYDAKTGADEKNTQITPFSGGSRVIQEGDVSLSFVKRLSLLLLFISGAGLGFLYYLTGSLFILGIGLVGLFLGISYTKPPLKLSYRGLGELTIGITFGLLAPLFSYAAQAEVTWSIVYAVLPFMFTVGAIILINEFPDRPADKAAGKKTLVVLLGIERSFVLYSLLLIAPFVLVLVSFFSGVVSMGALLVLILIPIALRLISKGAESKDDFRQLIPINAKTIQFHLLFGVLYTVGVGLGIFL